MQCKTGISFYTVLLLLFVLSPAMADSYDDGMCLFSKQMAEAYKDMPEPIQWNENTQVLGARANCKNKTIDFDLIFKGDAAKGLAELATGMCSTEGPWPEALQHGWAIKLHALSDAETQVRQLECTP